MKNTNVTIFHSAISKTNPEPVLFLDTTILLVTGEIDTVATDSHVLSILSPINTILRNISSPCLPLFFLLSLSFSSPLQSREHTKRRFIVVANGPSSWRHGRGDGIKSRRAARDLLIVATESSRRYPPWRRTPPSARDPSGALLHSSYDSLRRTLRAYTDELIFFFYRPRAHSPTVQPGPARLQQLLSPCALPPHPNTMHILVPFLCLVVVHLRSPVVPHTFFTPSP